MINMDIDKVLLTPEEFKEEYLKTILELGGVEINSTSVAQFAGKLSAYIESKVLTKFLSSPELAKYIEAKIKEAVREAQREM